MPDHLMIIRSRSAAVACAALLATALFGTNAHAQAYPPPQSYPPPPPQSYPPPPSQTYQPSPPPAAANPMCPRLEGQLAMIERGGLDPARDEQIRRYQDSAAKQQSELDRVTLQAKRMGCDSSGFFSLFTGQNAQCGPVNNQIQQMRANLEQITTNLERLRTGGLGGAERENQRQSVLLALAQNNCGPQYAAALQQQQQQQGPGGFLNNLFGNNNQVPPNASPIDPGAGGTYRTVCVRTCDGGYFPISFATIPARFPDDEKSCKALCPATEANLYAYRNPGEDINQAVSTSGQPYTALPNAFRFRQEFNPTCSCRAPGQSWADALKGIDDKAAAEQQGDIIVTEESAKKMSQPPASRPLTKGTQASKRGSAAATQPAPQNPPPAAVSDASPGNKTIRTVGPTFLPNNSH